MNLQAIYARIAELEEERDFYIDNRADFDFLESSQAICSLNAQCGRLRIEAVNIEADLERQAIVDRLANRVEEIVEVADEMIAEEEPVRTILDDFHSACDLDDLLSCSLEYLYELRDGLVSEFDMNAQDNWEIRLIDTRIAQYNEETIEVVAETVEDEPATEVASDDWLLEEWDNICSDPAGERFNRPTPAPAFNTYFEYVLWVIGEVVRGITYLLGEVNELFVSSQTTQLAT